MRYIVFLLMFSSLFSNGQSLEHFPVIDVHLHSNDSLSHIPNIKPSEKLNVISPSTYSEFKKQFFSDSDKFRSRGGSFSLANCSFVGCSPCKLTIVPP